MRTNPFLDTWLFILGLTDVPYAEGAFKYAFVVLFFGLLAASAVIAFVNWREDPAQRSRTHIAICICRVLVGCMWFQGCLWKLPWPIADGFRYWTEQMAQYAAFGFHRALVTNVYLPYLSVIDPLVFLAELSFATSLILGFAVRSSPCSPRCFLCISGSVCTCTRVNGPELHLSRRHPCAVCCAPRTKSRVGCLFARRDITGFARAFG